jgi:hypothetical protein
VGFDFYRERGFGFGFDVKVNGCGEKKKWLELFMMTGTPVRDRRRWRCFGESLTLNGRSC